jgi:hypothetical protein
MIYPKKLHDSVREYLAFIGARGGSVSRRKLTKGHAKQMVVIREALKVARKEGRTLSARERKRLALPPAEKAVRRRAPQFKRNRFFYPNVA